MAKEKAKTLGDYITGGRHEFVAHVRDMMSLSDTSRSNYGTYGNDLGNIHLGVLVCDRKWPSEGDESSRRQERAVFYFKEKPVYGGDSDITRSSFSYSERVVSEVPLAIEIHSFYDGWNLKEDSEEFNEARKLLEQHGLY